MKIRLFPSSRFAGLVLCLAGLSALPGARAQEAEPPAQRVTGQESAAGAQVQINQIETSAFPKVTIFATVLKDGQPVKGLSASNFRVREDEVDRSRSRLSQSLPRSPSSSR